MLSGNVVSKQAVLLRVLLRGWSRDVVSVRADVVPEHYRLCTLLYIGEHLGFVRDLVFGGAEEATEEYVQAGEGIGYDCVYFDPHWNACGGHRDGESSVGVAAFNHTMVCGSLVRGILHPVCTKIHSRLLQNHLWRGSRTGITTPKKALGTDVPQSNPYMVREITI